MFIGDAFNYIYSTYHNYRYGYYIDQDKQLLFGGNHQANLKDACQAILENSQPIESATFQIPTETGWYGVRFRKNDLAISAVNAMVTQANCPLKSLTIDDRCLELHELEDLCNHLPGDTKLKVIHIKNVITKTNEERTRLQKLIDELSRKRITPEVTEEHIPTFGTTYH